MVEYRYELKFVISRYVSDVLKTKLSQVMQLDPHSISEEYSYDIRSLYFDDIYSSAFIEKRDGLEYRSKYRIRIYNFSDDVIKLECKHKDGNMTFKEDCDITRGQAEFLISRQYDQVMGNKPLLAKFLANANIKLLKPAVVVDYRRTAFTYPVSETRITFDENICSGRYEYDIFDRDLNTVPLCKSDDIVLEVKCNEFIPRHIIDILAEQPKLRLAISKFATCSSTK